jgi:galactitol-specific phosphotransferase system IIB component
MDTAKEFVKVFCELLNDSLANKFAPNTRHSLASIVDTIVYTATRQSYVEGSAIKLRGKSGGRTPSPDTVFRRLKELSMDQILDIFEAFVVHTIYRARKKGFLDHPVDVAIDGHDEPYYGKERPPEVRGTKEKAGTNYAYQYLVADIVVDGERFTLAILPVPALANMPALVKRILERIKLLVTIRKVLLDRGFYSVDVITELLNAGMTYEMPIPWTSKVQEVIKRNRGFRYAIEDFTVGSDKRTVKTTLVVAPSTRKKRQMSERDPQFVFITNGTIDEQSIPFYIADYDKRWGIETGFRVRKDFWIKTNTDNPLIRYLFFFLAAMLYDFWLLANLLSGWKPNPHYDYEIIAREFRDALEDVVFAMFILGTNS